MNTNLQFEFLVNKPDNTLIVKREFAADRQLIWNAYTTRELLDQWFAPQPLSTTTKYMDFSPGGYWHYALIEPTGTEYWCRMDYQEIQPINYYVAWDAFTDSSGHVNPGLPRAKWKVSFSDEGSNTVVETIVSYASLADLEQIINMGMQQGMESTLRRLDELIEKIN